METANSIPSHVTTEPASSKSLSKRRRLSPSIEHSVDLSSDDDFEFFTGEKGDTAVCPKMLNKGRILNVSKLASQRELGGVSDVITISSSDEEVNEEM